MPQLNVTMTLSYGSPVGTNTTPWKEPLSFTLSYTEESVKTVAIAASTVDFPVALDTVTAPKFLFIRCLETEVTVKLVSGADESATAMRPSDGWVMIANSAGQAINSLLVTTPVLPATGARVQILAFE